MRADVVGPVCETGDFLARDREIANVLPGDFLAVCTAGAYGFVAASNYNSRPRPPEVLVEGAAWRVVRARETFDDLVRGETVGKPSAGDRRTFPGFLWPARRPATPGWPLPASSGPFRR